jgi:ribosome maturation factor RimP
MITAEKIATILEGILPEFDAFFVGVNLSRSNHRLSVEVFVDTDSGIVVGQCAEISRRLASVIEEQALIDIAYELQVSSPGIDKPLKLLRQYKKNIGRKFRVILQDGASTRTLEGTLVSIEEERLAFRTEQGDHVTVRFAQIIESKEVLPW